METKVERNSSLELFRILSAFLVLIVHWNGWFVEGLPEVISYDLFLYRGGQLLMRSMSVCCVNCFVLLSGYFGIKLKLKSVVNIWLNLVAIFVPFYIFEIFRTGVFSIVDFAKCIEGFSKGGYFIQNYLLLMLISPALNSFVEKYNDKVTKWTILLFFVEVWFYCVMRVETMGFEHGSSFIHFLLMYMIGRSIFINLDKLHQIKKSVWICGYSLCVVLLCLLRVLNIGHSWGYCNPLVILSSICLLMPFTYKVFYNKAINYIACSTLAVFIMQCFNPCRWLLVSIDNWALNSLPYYQYLLISIVVIVLFFFLCIGYDKLRLKITVPISNQICNTKNRYGKD